MLCALVALICLDVAARSLKLFPTPWTFDVCQHLLAAITFLGAPWVLRENGHIAIELVVERLARGPRAVVQRVADVLGTAVCALLLVYACRVFWRTYASGNLVYETFVFPEWYLYTLAPPVFLALLALYVRRLWRGPGAPAGAEPPRESVF
ncbi:MAG TPA: TRAP transporter small permease [Burkholderiales bacterium]|nr:TRAP transporter small permease [Burkholderiales bacterium]